MEYHSSPERTNEAGFLSIPRQVFCYVDYLGYIAFEGNGKTKNAEDFLKEYFPKKYKDYKNTSFKSECNIRFKENNKVRPHTFFMGNNRQQVIKNQVLNAWSNVSGVINSNGETA